MIRRTIKLTTGSVLAAGLLLGQAAWAGGGGAGVGGAVRIEAARIQIVVPVPMTPEVPTQRLEDLGLEVTGRGFASDVNLQGSLDPLLEGLRSDQFARREEATSTLMRLPYERLSDVREALTRERDVEAASRLRDVAMHLFLKKYTPLAGNASLLGIKLNLEVIRPDPKREEVQMSVAVAELQPGYPAAQELRVGDRLIAINGKRFPPDMSIDDFRASVNAHRPGSIVQFTLIREGKTMEVPVQMAGILQPGVLNISDAIERRAQAMRLFAAGIKSQAEEAPVVMHDPDAHSLERDFGGSIIRVAPRPPIIDEQR